LGLTNKRSRELPYPYSTRWTLPSMFLLIGDIFVSFVTVVNYVLYLMILRMDDRVWA
jgi:hypothetical protein